ncbi:hypothetical protein PBY51_010242 [Eleginops maclovinus]|uniref:Uncharacterized protein n=1 Tax=Eleginops maclovinus TaxID=56733 RepID=A0AAN7X636_ELEMC|nr:hypothetical protein PBY51_010242 [Eleginops maclovinus]
MCSLGPSAVAEGVMGHSGRVFVQMDMCPGSTQLQVLSSTVEADQSLFLHFQNQCSFHLSKASLGPG